MPEREAELSTRALVVEDDPNIVDMIRVNLAVRGFETMVATTGRALWKFLEKPTRPTSSCST